MGDLFSSFRERTPDPQIAAPVFGPCSIHVHLGVFKHFFWLPSEMQVRSKFIYQIIIPCRVFSITGIMYSSTSAVLEYPPMHSPTPPLALLC